MSAPSFKTRALQGSMWTMGGYGASASLRLLSHLILAWLLTPEIFGLMALVKVFMRGLGMFSDIGIGPSIIQNNRGSDPVFLNTAWTIQIIRGFALWLVTCLLVGPFAWWYAQNDPAAWQLVYLLPVAALVTIIEGFNSTALFTLNKELRLGWVTMIELVTQVVSLAVMIVWALVHPSIWAMVAGGLAASATKLAASHLLASEHRHRLQWDPESRRELIKFGKWIFLSTGLTFLALKLDVLLLGRFLTLSDLGVYSIAAVFSKGALDVASRLGSSVMFPVYAKFKDQPEKLMGVAISAREVVLWIGAAVCICFAVSAPLFFETFWDSRYHQAGMLAQWLTLYMWARLLLNSMDRIPLALGDSKALFLSGIVQNSGILFALAGYWSGGLPYFILGLTAGPLASHLFLLRRVPSRSGEMLRQSVRFTLLGALAGIILVGWTSWLRTTSLAPVWIVSVIFSALLPLVVSASIAYRRVYRDKKKSA